MFLHMGIFWVPHWHEDQRLPLGFGSTQPKVTQLQHRLTLSQMHRLCDPEVDL